MLKFNWTEHDDSLEIPDTGQRFWRGALRCLATLLSGCISLVPHRVGLGMGVAMEISGSMRLKNSGGICSRMAIFVAVFANAVASTQKQFEKVQRGAGSINRNVLLMISDDLRTDLSGAYGHPEVHTPHLDQFAKESLIFDHAYCQVPWCSPSRNSFMASRRPDHHRVWASGDPLRRSPTVLPRRRHTASVIQRKWFHHTRARQDFSLG